MSLGTQTHQPDKVKLLTVFFVAMHYKSRTVVRKIFSNFGLLLVLTCANAEQAEQHYTLPGATQVFWKLFDGKLRLNPMHAKCALPFSPGARRC
jgi:hypothetical protein